MYGGDWRIVTGQYGWRVLKEKEWNDWIEKERVSGWREGWIDEKKGGLMWSVLWMTLLALCVITVNSNKAGIEVASIAGRGIECCKTASERERQEQHAFREKCLCVCVRVKRRQSVGGRKGFLFVFCLISEIVGFAFRRNHFGMCMNQESIHCGSFAGDEMNEEMKRWKSSTNWLPTPCKVFLSLSLLLLFSLCMSVLQILCFIGTRQTVPFVLLKHLLL